MALSTKHRTTLAAELPDSDQDRETQTRPKSRHLHQALEKFKRTGLNLSEFIDAAIADGVKVRRQR